MQLPNNIPKEKKLFSRFFFLVRVQLEILQVRVQPQARNTEHRRFNSLLKGVYAIKSYRFLGD